MNKLINIVLLLVVLTFFYISCYEDNDSNKPLETTNGLDFNKPLKSISQTEIDNQRPSGPSGYKYCRCYFSGEKNTVPHDSIFSHTTIEETGNVRCKITYYKDIIWLVREVIYEYAPVSSDYGCDGDPDTFKNIPKWLHDTERDTYSQDYEKSRTCCDRRPCTKNTCVECSTGDCVQ